MDITRHDSALSHVRRISAHRRTPFNAAAKVFFVLVPFPSTGLQSSRKLCCKTCSLYSVTEAKTAPATEAMEAGDWTYKTVHDAMHNLDEREKKASKEAAAKAAAEAQ